LKAESGDKVKLKAGRHRGERGVVAAVEGAKLVVRLDGSGQEVWLAPEDVTNFSLAARKAWVTGPDRAVGRRKGTRLSDRVSVTLRIDRELWDRFVELEEAGVIADRTALVNGWLRDKLTELDRGERDSGCPQK
jgi:hypothetical protein